MNKDASRLCPCTTNTTPNTPARPVHIVPRSVGDDQPPV